MLNRFVWNSKNGLSEHNLPLYYYDNNYLEYYCKREIFKKEKNHNAVSSMWFSDSKEGDPSYHKVQNFNLLVQSVREIYIHRPHVHHSMSEV